jgi:hypothetical protein
VTRIEPDGTMQRRMVDTAQRSDRRLWEDLAARAAGVAVPYRPAVGIAVYQIRVDDYVVMAAEHDLAGPLLDLATAVMALGGEMLRQGLSPNAGSSPSGRTHCPMAAPLAPPRPADYSKGGLGRS